MLRKILGTIAGVLILSGALFADQGSVTRVDTATRQIVVKVGEDTYTASADDVDLLDKDGNAARIDEFKAGASIDVTIEEGKVTKIQMQ